MGAAEIGEVGTAAAGDENLFADAIGMVEQEDATSAAAGFGSAEEARGAGAEDDDVVSLVRGQGGPFEAVRTCSIVAAGRTCDHRRMAKVVEIQALRVGKAHAQGPAAVVTRRAADKLRAGSAWVYRTDVEQVLPALGAEGIEPGALVTVLDGRGIPLGSALFSAASQITLRMVSDVAGLTREAYLADGRGAGGRGSGSAGGAGSGDGRKQCLPADLFRGGSAAGDRGGPVQRPGACCRC